MSEMIERVAEKLYDESGLTINHKIFWEHLAKAAISAMREPTEAMMLAAEKAEPQLECFLVKEESPSYLVWQAMIDEALK